MRGRDSGPTIAFACITIKFGEALWILDELLWFCIDKMEKKIRPAVVSSEIPECGKSTALVLHKSIQTPFPENNY